MRRPRPASRDPGASPRAGGCIPASPHASPRASPRAAGRGSRPIAGGDPVWRGPPLRVGSRGVRERHKSQAHHGGHEADRLPLRALAPRVVAHVVRARKALERAGHGDWRPSVRRRRGRESTKDASPRRRRNCAPRRAVPQQRFRAVSSRPPRWRGAGRGSGGWTGWGEVPDADRRRGAGGERARAASRRNRAESGLAPRCPARARGLATASAPTAAGQTAASPSALANPILFFLRKRSRFNVRLRASRDAVTKREKKKREESGVCEPAVRRCGAWRRPEPSRACVRP